MFEFNGAGGLSVLELRNGEAALFIADSTSYTPQHSKKDNGTELQRRTRRKEWKFGVVGIHTRQRISDSGEGVSLLARFPFRLKSLADRSPPFSAIQSRKWRKRGDAKSGTCER